MEGQGVGGVAGGEVSRCGGERWEGCRGGT
jgi:hypothetical protein